MQISRVGGIGEAVEVLQKHIDPIGAFACGGLAGIGLGPIAGNMIREAHVAVAGMVFFVRTPTSLLRRSVSSRSVWSQPRRRMPASTQSASCSPASMIRA